MSLTKYQTVFLGSSPTILWVMKSRRMRWAGDIVHVGEGRGAYQVLVDKPEGKNHWGNPSVNGRILLRQIFRKWALVNTVMNLQVP
jgi:hypothetical protein